MGVVNRVAGTLVRLAVLGVGVGALIVAGGAWYVHTMSSERLSSVAEVAPAPVALVLGAEIYPDGTPSRYLRARLDLAYELFRAGKVKAILVSGDGGEVDYNEPDGMRRYLLDRGVPAAKVVADYAGFDTYDSCVRARQVFGVTHAILVSQTYHLPRAVATCRVVGVEAWGVGDESARSNQSMWWLGTAREYGANLKMFVDVLSRREPLLGPREYSVDEAVKAG